MFCRQHLEPYVNFVTDHIFNFCFTHLNTLGQFYFFFENFLINDNK